MSVMVRTILLLMRISNIDLAGGGGWQLDPNLPPPVASQLPFLLSLTPPFSPFLVLKYQAFLHNFLLFLPLHAL